MEHSSEYGVVARGLGRFAQLQTTVEGLRVDSREEATVRTEQHVDMGLGAGPFSPPACAL